MAPHDTLLLLFLFLLSSAASPSLSSPLLDVCSAEWVENNNNNKPWLELLY